MPYNHFFKLLAKIVVIFCCSSAFFCLQAYSEQSYDYNDTPSHFKSDLGRLFFGNSFENPNANSQNVQNAPTVKMGFSTNLSCGNLDLNAFSNLEQYKQLLDQTLKNVEGKLSAAKDDLIVSAPLLLVCYASPTMCAELRHDSFMFNQKLGLATDACNQIDKFIDDKADQGAKTLKSEAISRCMAQNSPSMGSAVAFDHCRNKSGLAFQDFQHSIENLQTSSSQKIVDSMANYQAYLSKSPPDNDLYSELVAMIGETTVHQDGTYQKSYPTNSVISPQNLAKKYMNNGMNIACNTSLLKEYIGGSNQGSDLFTKNFSFVAKKNLSFEDIYDLESLSLEDQKISCAALGRALARESGFHCANQLEGSIALGMGNAAIPETFKNQVKLESDANLKTLAKALESENAPSVKQIQTLIHRFALATRARNQAIASSLSSAKANSYQHSLSTSQCTDTLSCNN